MLDVNCRLKLLLNPEAQSITVGEVVKLHCQLEPGQSWPPIDQLKVVVPSDQQLAFYVHQVGLLNSQELEILSTSVVVGDHQIQGVKLTHQDQEAYLLAPFNLKVASVIDQQKPIKEPFGPMIIQNPMLPMNLLITVLAIFIISFVLGFWRLFKLLRYRRQVKAFNKLVDETIPAYQQLSRGLKAIRQSPRYWDKNFETEASPEVNELVKLFQQEFDIYVSRIYQIPLPQWSPNKKMRWYKKLGQSYQAKDIELSKLWFEVQTLSSQPMSGRDLRYIYNHAIQWALSQKNEGGT